jgi:hypothetical protein
MPMPLLFGASIFPCLRKLLQPFPIPQLTLCWSFLLLPMQAKLDLGGTLLQTA